MYLQFEFSLIKLGFSRKFRALELSLSLIFAFELSQPQVYKYVIIFI